MLYKGTRKKVSKMLPFNTYEVESDHFESMRMKIIVFVRPAGSQFSAEKTFRNITN